MPLTQKNDFINCKINHVHVQLITEVLYPHHPQSFIKFLKMCSNFSDSTPVNYVFSNENKSCVGSYFFLLYDVLSRVCIYITGFNFVSRSTAIIEQNITCKCRAVTYFTIFIHAHMCFQACICLQQSCTQKLRNETSTLTGFV